MDGGIRRGTDVLKALALGANAVLIVALTATGWRCGAEGVSRVINILRGEFEVAMALTAARHIKALIAR